MSYSSCLLYLTTFQEFEIAQKKRPVGVLDIVLDIVLTDDFGITDVVMVTRQDKNCVTSAISVLRRMFQFTLLRSAVSVNLNKTASCSSTNNRRTLRQF